MPALLHEYWESEDGAEFYAVRERNDQLRPKLHPNARLSFSLYASSWFEACQLEHERLGFGDYTPPDNIPDYAYTTKDAAEQKAYLKKRDVS